MSVKSHLEELKRKHQALDAEIVEKQRSPSVSQLDLQSLKKRKLRLKEQIERSRTQVA
ncbi:MAG: DUF465 domain-containing protein [Pseudomonadota bacterium]